MFFEKFIIRASLFLQSILNLASYNLGNSKNRKFSQLDLWI